MSKWTLQPHHFKRYREMISTTPYKAPPGTFAIPLGYDFWTIVDIRDADLVSRYNWHLYPNKSAIYVVSSTGSGDANRKRRLHRLIMNPPDDMVVDHINGNTLDNTRSNLRVCTHQQNVCNRRDLFGGVCFIPPREAKWIVKVNGMYIGAFDTEQEAVTARSAALQAEFDKRGGVHAV